MDHTAWMTGSKIGTATCASATWAAKALTGMCAWLSLAAARFLRRPLKGVVRRPFFYNFGLPLPKPLALRASEKSPDTARGK